MGKCPYCWSATGDDDIICFNCGAGLQYATKTAVRDIPREDIRAFEAQTNYVNTRDQPDDSARRPRSGKKEEKKGFFSRIFGA